MQEVKIDKSFVMNMATDDNDAVIVRSTIDLGHNLGLRVVAEGVEDEQTWRRLVELGCDVAQGYFIAKPLPSEAVLDWLTRSPWQSGALSDRRAPGTSLAAEVA